MLQPGQEFGNFVIERKLGEGGMGAVYLAEDRKLQRSVALKVLQSDAFDDRERRDRFYREARTAAQVSHPNVMGIYDVDEAVLPDRSEKQLYIVMEYIPGTSLKPLLTQSRLDTGKMLRYAEKIAAGLAAAHQKGIVHRDIKAENIIVDENDEPRILDFGLAKPTDPVHFDDAGNSEDTVSQELTRAGKILGTVKYMSPEQVRGEKVDNRSDVFSFGILLYEMCTGEAPFAGSTQVSTLAKILESEPQPLHVKNANAPAELERILTKCLRKDAADRYQDTRDLVVDLRQLRKQYDSGVTDSVSISGQVPRLGGAGVVARMLKINLSWKLVIVILVGMVIVSGLVEQCIEKDTPLRTDVGLGDVDKALLEASALAKHLQTGNRLAILQFVNSTGDPDLAWMQTGLPEIMLTGLAQAEDITVISPHRILNHMGAKSFEDSDTEEYIEAAAKLGASKLLYGSIFKAGDKLRIESRLEDIESGTVLLGERATGADPFALVDSLTYKIAASLDAASQMDPEATAARFASSPEAYKVYHEGMEYYNEARWDEAVERFNEAIDIDSAFALPYMRIGMVSIFRGRQQEGAAYLGAASRYRERLPRSDRALLEVYTDIWQRQQFEAAVDKLKRIVETFPDNTEGRLFYALVEELFSRDTAAAFAQLDTVLSLDPGDAFALQQYVELKAKYEKFDEAAELARRLKRQYPESPVAYTTLWRVYVQQNKVNEALEVMEEMRERYPDNDALLESMYLAFIRVRNFDRSRVALEQLRKTYSDSPLYMADYYTYRANLNNWRGKFLAGLEDRRSALVEAEKSGDRDALRQTLGSIAATFARLDMDDSSLVYRAKAYEVSNPFQRVNYSLSVVELRPDRAEEMRPVFRADVREFRKRLPEQNSGLADAVEALFAAHCAVDTPALVLAHEQLVAEQLGGDERELGEILVLTGEYSKGLEHLLSLIDSREEPTSAWNNLSIRYHIARAWEGLGENEKAVEQYRTLLRYWGDPDTDIEMVTDAQARLARLTS
jgi:serine/threonine-protein kinase